jgi:hypothetical protein
MRGSLSHNELEEKAAQFASAAPVGFTYDAVVADLLRGITRLSIHKCDFERARKYHAQLERIDPETADKMADDIWSPAEQRLRRKLKAEKVRREIVAEVRAQEAAVEFRRWREDFDKNFGGYR